MKNYIYKTIKDTNEVELLEKWLVENKDVDLHVWNAENAFFRAQPPEYGMTQENWERFDHEKHKLMPTDKMTQELQIESCISAEKARIQTKQAITRELKRRFNHIVSQISTKIYEASTKGASFIELYCKIDPEVQAYLLQLGYSIKCYSDDPEDYITRINWNDPQE